MLPELLEEMGILLAVQLFPHVHYQGGWEAFRRSLDSSFSTSSSRSSRSSRCCLSARRRSVSDGDFASLVQRTAPNHSVSLEAFTLDDSSHDRILPSDTLAGSVGARSAASGMY